MAPRNLARGVALALVAADLDAPRRGLRPLRTDDLEDAVAAARLAATRVRAVGQRETAVEAAVTTLDARIALGFAGAFAAALAANGQQALVHRHLDVVRIDAGKVCVQDEAVVLFLDVDARHPLAGGHRALVGTGLDVVEQAVEHLPEFVQRFWPGQRR